MPKHNWFTKLFDRRLKPAPAETRDVGGAVARKTTDTYFSSYFTPVIARAGVVTSYAEFSEEALNKLPDNKKREVIKGASPIVAKAIADYADAMASGFTYTADRMMEVTQGTPAQNLIDTFFLRLEKDSVGMEGLTEQVARGMFTHGASFTELIIDKDKKTPVTIKDLDPSTAVFRQAEDDIIGDYYELGQDIGVMDGRSRGKRARNRIVQRQFSTVGGYNFLSLHNNPTVKYRPIQAEPNYPYGIPLLDPAVFHVIMMAGFLSAFRTALSGHVYPNLLITIDKKMFSEFAGVSGDTQALQDKLNKNIADIKEAVGKLKPGGAIVQGKEVEISGSLTGTGKTPLGSIKEIQDVLRRDLIVAVQSQPVLMGSNESVTETHADIQMLSYGRLIRRSQKGFNATITGYLDFILELNGYPPLSEFKLNYENSAQYRQQANTFKDFREGLKLASDDLMAFSQALTEAKNAGFMSEQEAQAAWDEGMELRRQVNLLPQEL